MALFLTSRLVPAHPAPQCTPFGFCAPVSRPAYSYRVSRPQPRRPAYPSYNHVVAQVDELLTSIAREAQRQAQIEALREAQREAHCQRQQRKQALRAKFAVSQNEKGWQMNGDVHGFEQENISIEVTDEHTLKVAGNTKWRSEVHGPQEAAAEHQVIEGPKHDNTNDSSPANPDTQSASDSEPETVRSATPSSDTESHKSYQAFVEDDFEDLGAEASSLFSTPPEALTTAVPNESKGKEKVVDEPVDPETAVVQQPQAKVPDQQVQQQHVEKEDRVHGSFEQTFTFPERIDANNVSASFKDGVLRITVPRAPTMQTRRIALL